MTDDKHDRTGEDLRDVNERAADEARAWNGDLEASQRREIDERFNDARGDRSSLPWGGGGLAREDRTDSITSVVSGDAQPAPADEAEARSGDAPSQGDSRRPRRESDREAP